MMNRYFVHQWLQGDSISGSYRIASSYALNAVKFQISERTIPGTMDDSELLALYSGYGYQVRFVEFGAVSESAEETEKQTLALNKNMAVSMEWALQEIRKIQKAARSGKPIVKARWPLIIMRTPKVR